jgi:acyl-coenzyme A thioesterase PaaI-like protein
MPRSSPSRSAGKIYGVWTGSMDDLVSYRYVGCSSVRKDRTHAEGRMRIRRDLRTRAGLRGAPLAIAALDTAGINVDPFHQLALTRIDVHVIDDGAGVEAVRVVGTVLREARTQVFTEATIEDDADAGRVVGLATADWAILAPTPDGFVYTDPGPGVPDTPDLPPLTDAYDAHPNVGGGFVIPGLSPRVGADTLHHGPILVALEAAALEAAAHHAGTDELRVEHLSTRFVKAGRAGPFVARAEVAATRDDTLACRAELRDEGADGQIVAVALLRARAIRRKGEVQ